MSNGIVYGRRTREHLTDVRESFFSHHGMPTVLARDAGDSRRATARKKDWKSKPGVTLGDVAYLLATPAAADATRGPDLARAERPRSGGMDLVTMMEGWLRYELPPMDPPSPDGKV
jgi:hypothetical protein